MRAIARIIVGVQPCGPRSLLKHKSTLAYEEIVEGPADQGTEQAVDRTGIVLHGLLGTGRNWRTVVKTLVSNMADQHQRNWRMLLVDLRNHGSSSKLTGFNPPHSMEAAAEDVAELIHQKLGSTPNAIIGHSLGGKVALELLQQLAQPGHQLQLPQQVWVLDSQPGSFRSSAEPADSVSHILEVIKSVPLPVPSRQWLYEHLARQGVTQGTALWLGSNLTQGRSGQGLVWAFNIQGAAAMYSSYRSSSYWELLSCPPPGVALHVVRAMRSDRWTPETVQQLKSCQEQSQAAGARNPPTCGLLHVHELANAGHWLHTDNPSGLLDIMRPWFAT